MHVGISRLHLTVCMGFCCHSSQSWEELCLPDHFFLAHSSWRTNRKQKREATLSCFLSLPTYASCCRWIVSGEGVCMAGWSYLSLFIRPKQEERKICWVGTETQWRFDAVASYGSVPALLPGSLNISFFWPMGAQHFTHHCRFPPCGSCPILCPSPVRLLDTVQEGRKTPVPRGTCEDLHLLDL